MNKKGFVMFESIAVVIVVLVIIVAYFLYVSANKDSNQTGTVTPVETPTPLPTIEKLESTTADEEIEDIVEEFNAISEELELLDVDEDELVLPEVEFTIE